MFEVGWTEKALDELATLWTQSDSANRANITSASNRIDQELRTDPEHKGESRAEGERVFFATPLGILYEVDVAASAMWVLHVWDIRRMAYWVMDLSIPTMAAVRRLPMMS